MGKRWFMRTASLVEDMCSLLVLPGLLVISSTNLCISLHRRSCRVAAKSFDPAEQFLLSTGGSTQGLWLRA
jgi:hypothetical protein